MAELKYDEAGVPVRKFPLKLVNRDGVERQAHTETDVVQLNYDGFAEPAEVRQVEKAAARA